MLFKTIYIAPIIPTLTNSGGVDIERGASIVGDLIIVYTQNGGGVLDDYVLDARVNGVLKASLAGLGPAVPNTDLQNINGYSLVAAPITNQISTVNCSGDYLIGPIPVDNKGITYPADRIAAGTAMTTATWTSRYPIWYGSSINKYSVPDASLTDLSVPPTITEAMLRNLVSTKLFIVNSIETDVINSGDVTILVALPAGLSIAIAEINVAGTWTNFEDLKNNSIIVPVSAIDGTAPRNYTVYYARCIAANNFPTDQNYRFTTTGNIIP